MAKVKKKILVVEDERALARAIQLKLQNEDFEVAMATDGEEAWRKIQDEKPHLILLDLILPRLDGFELLQKIKKENVKTPVFVISNLSQDQDIARAKKMGAKEYFVKSDTPVAEIVEKIKKAIED